MFLLKAYLSGGRDPTSVYIFDSARHFYDAQGLSMSAMAFLGSRLLLNELQGGEWNMITRKLNRTEDEISLLGFGMMRLPLHSKDQGDIEKLQSLLDYAIANGINYFEMAYPYHNGKSEIVIGRTVKKIFARELSYCFQVADLAYSECGRCQPILQ